ncbi:MAG TPA: tRNA (N(6)-L-threonylcarbamoyladenosine(37)-C(2))-methylthiotransferase MtaB [Candidatus Erysipelatoclostridium merdavium]|uniref:Threonylcarbamoyladenosine tRNA methylthiotransferase MtaB n=1 Tax=Candidatus Erysipelatoclostridium merdavium TaxID=2838566 RepID=A0A9D1XMQ2_9FIRM|nr:tRNA (N(6)-L-threonylcarbamoyladenosine(37)-C(2))-methylthiotransferase MtaB [Candidatus Erysipelatoclostridium merdavium]
MKTVAFHTLGCKVNTYESNAMLKIFQDAGYQEVDFKEVADVYVINTCTVTNTGDSKSRQMIRKAIRKNPEAIVCAVGCYSQVAPEDIEQIEGIGVILGTQYRKEIVDLVEEYQKTNQKIVKVDSVKNLRKFEDLNIDRFKNTRAFLKIQDGCNNFCTYCIIPYARGRVRSRKPESVLKQAELLVSRGYVEIVLTGIHTAGYGEDLENYSFYDLLVDLVKIKGLKRLRISSIETSQITDEIIDLIGSNDIIVDHLHVPLQSGCDATLKRMNRKYTTEQYLEKINKIRSYLPNIAFTTDVIVGFPGETDEEFQATYDFIKKVNYSQLHVFPYSPRKNTPAAKMKDQINDQVKHQRVERLLELSKQLNYDFAMKQIDKTLKVLFEKRSGDYLIGHASDYLQVKVKTNENLIGEIVNIKIEKYSDMLEGSIAS